MENHMTTYIRLYRLSGRIQSRSIGYWYIQPGRSANKSHKKSSGSLHVDEEVIRLEMNSMIGE